MTTRTKAAAPAPAPAAKVDVAPVCYICRETPSKNWMPCKSCAAAYDAGTCTTFNGAKIGKPSTGALSLGDWSQSVYPDGSYEHFSSTIKPAKASKEVSTVTTKAAAAKAPAAPAPAPAAKVSKAKAPVVKAADIKAAVADKPASSAPAKVPAKAKAAKVDVAPAPATGKAKAPAKELPGAKPATLHGAPAAPAKAKAPRKAAVTHNDVSGGSSRPATPANKAPKTGRAKVVLSAPLGADDAPTSKNVLLARLAELQEAQDLIMSMINGETPAKVSKAKAPAKAKAAAAAAKAPAKAKAPKAAKVEEATIYTPKARAGSAVGAIKAVAMTQAERTKAVRDWKSLYAALTRENGHNGVKLNGKDDAKVRETVPMPLLAQKSALPASEWAKVLRRKSGPALLAEIDAAYRLMCAATAKPGSYASATYGKA